MPGEDPAKTWMYCPGCNTDTVCTSKSKEDEDSYWLHPGAVKRIDPKSRNFTCKAEETGEIYFHFFKRLRRCSECDHNFYTAEVDYATLKDRIEELLHFEGLVVELKKRNVELEEVVENARFA